MAERVLRKRRDRLNKRIKAYETEQTGKGGSSKHEHHKPGSMNGRK
jgi:hypothetical protein